MKLQSKILIIEDDQKFAKTLCNVLSLHNYDVCMVINGALGIQKAFEYKPDLILCDIKMDPIDGYQVYNVLKESSILDTIPFIFITGSSDIQEIRFGMDLGADDYFVKPFNNDDLICGIEKRLLKFKKLKEIGKNGFDALFKLSPNGKFIFDGEFLCNANQALIKTFGLNPNRIISYTVQDIIGFNSYQAIEDKIQRCSKGLLDNFSENITIVSHDGIETEVTLHISVYEKYSVYSLMLGLIMVNYNGNGDRNDIIISEVLHVLKKENISVTGTFGEKLSAVFKRHSVNLKQQKNEIFSKRETQVLCLSMEGLPMKIIADRLSISDRTVEKHRASMMAKTGSNNMIEVIVFALRNNLLEI